MVLAQDLLISWNLDRCGAPVEVRTRQVCLKQLSEASADSHLYPGEDFSRGTQTGAGASRKLLPTIISLLVWRYVSSKRFFLNEKHVIFLPHEICMENMEKNKSSN